MLLKNENTVTDLLNQSLTLKLYSKYNTVLLNKSRNLIAMHFSVFLIQITRHFITRYSSSQLLTCNCEFRYQGDSGKLSILCCSGIRVHHNI